MREETSATILTVEKQPREFTGIIFEGLGTM